MANEYSVIIHDFISARRAAAEQRQADARARADEAMVSYWQGQLDEWDWLRRYLRENTDLKGFIYY
ncbi:MAG: hypothetical protein P8X39_02780 [Desulfofustis sp.]|jgi:hypothetical protein